MKRFLISVCFWACLSFICFQSQSVLYAQASPYILYKNGGWTHHNTFQAAYDALGHSSDNPGTIYLPPSTRTSPIRLTTLGDNEIELYGGQTLVGTGHETYIAPPSLGEASTDVVKFMGNAGLVNLTLTRTTTSISSTTGSGINLNGFGGTLEGVSIERHRRGIYDSTNSNITQVLSIRNCYIAFVKDALIDLDSGGSIATLLIWKSLFQYSDDYGLKLKIVPGNTRLIDSHVQFCDNDCVRLNNSTDVYMEGFQADSTEGHALFLEGVTKRIRITGSSVFASSGITVTAPSNWTDPWTTNYGTRVADKSGIFVGPFVNDVLLADSYVTYNGDAGITLYNAGGFSTGPDNVRIIGNVFISNSMYGAGKPAIKIDGDTNAIDHVLVSGNRAYNDGSLGTNQDYGLTADGKVNYLMIVGNDFHDSNHTASISDGSTRDSGVPAHVIANNF